MREEEKLTWFMYKLCKDKQLRKFVSEIMDCGTIEKIMEAFREEIEAGLITIKLVKNNKDRYRFHVSNGLKVFDVHSVDNSKIDKMMKAFNINK